MGLTGVECFLDLRKLFSKSKVVSVFVRGTFSAVIFAVSRHHTKFE